MLWALAAGGVALLGAAGIAIEGPVIMEWVEGRIKQEIEDRAKELPGLAMGAILAGAISGDTSAFGYNIAEPQDYQ